MLLDRVYAERDRRRQQLAIMIARSAPAIDLDSIRLLKSDIADLDKTIVMLQRSAAEQPDDRALKRGEVDEPPPSAT